MCDFEFLAIIAAVIAFLSELLPFVDHNANGVIHAIICLLQSDCVNNHFLKNTTSLEDLEQFSSTEINETSL